MELMRPNPSRHRCCRKREALRTRGSFERFTSRVQSSRVMSPLISLKLESITPAHRWNGDHRLIERSCLLLRCVYGRVVACDSSAAYSTADDMQQCALVRLHGACGPHQCAQHYLCRNALSPSKRCRGIFGTPACYELTILSPLLRCSIDQRRGQRRSSRACQDSLSMLGLAASFRRYFLLLCNVA